MNTTAAEHHERLTEARRMLNEAVEGTNTPKDWVIERWPAGVPGLKPSTYGSFTVDQVTLIELFVDEVCDLLDWVRISPEQLEEARALWLSLDESALKAIEVWKFFEEIPNLTSPHARLYHWKRSMVAMEAAAADEEIAG